MSLEDETRRRGREASRSSKERGGERERTFQSPSEGIAANKIQDSSVEREVRYRRCWPSRDEGLGVELQPEAGPIETSSVWSQVPEPKTETCRRGKVSKEEASLSLMESGKPEPEDVTSEGEDDSPLDILDLPFDRPCW